jgi:hypothetical protein
MWRLLALALPWNRASRWSAGRRWPLRHWGRASRVAGPAGHARGARAGPFAKDLPRESRKLTKSIESKWVSCKTALNGRLIHQWVRDRLQNRKGRQNDRSRRRSPQPLAVFERARAVRAARAAAAVAQALTGGMAHRTPSFPVYARAARCRWHQALGVEVMRGVSCAAYGMAEPMAFLHFRSICRTP